MFKKLLCLICLLIDIICISSFIIYIGDMRLLIFGIMISLSIIFIINNKKIKNFIFRVITDLFIVFTFILVVYLIIDFIITLTNTNIAITNDFIKPLILIVITIYLFMNHLFDLKKDVSNTNFILTITISLITILIYINYYFNPLFYHNNVTIFTDISISYEYIYQNYIYFIILYGSLLTNYYVMKK